MPTYEFRCPECTDFDLIFDMRSVPDVAQCPRCGGTSRRRVSAPRLSRGGSAAARLIESTQRSAHEPEVVDSPAPRRRSAPTQRYTSNPLHQKLPRP